MSFTSLVRDISCKDRGVFAKNTITKENHRQQGDFQEGNWVGVEGNWKLQLKFSLH
jgi:hypothetical protein